MQSYPSVIPDLSLHLYGSALGSATPGQAGISSIVCTPQPFSQQRHTVRLLNNPDRPRLHQKYKSNHGCDNLSYFTLTHKSSSAIIHVAPFLPHDQQRGPLQPPHLTACVKMSLCIEQRPAKPTTLQLPRKSCDRKAVHGVQQVSTWARGFMEVGAWRYGQSKQLFEITLNF